MANFQKIVGLHNIGGMTRRAGKRNRGRAVLAMVCALMTVTAAGCGKTEEPVPVDLSSGNMEELKNETDEDSGANDADAQSAGNEQLEGDVRSVESDSFVICKNDTWIEDGVSYAVAPAPGNEEESDLVTIHMAENCVYQYDTVKNSGINPEDVSSRAGSLADLKEGLAVTIKGKWQTDGSFLADSIVMMSIE